MKLSTAILKGCVLYPHHSRYIPYDNANGASTLGAAYAALVDGKSEWVRNYQTDYEYKEFPVLTYWVWDPISHANSRVEQVIWIYENPLGRFRWSRERLAKWVARHEKKWVKQGKKVDAYEMSEVKRKVWGPKLSHKWFGKDVIK
jgi:hypothetical protein